ncbi:MULTISPECIES: type II CAAX prenyl endopeptidase Rce1 family protein [Clostridium]|nr:MULTISPECIES: CPBP family glutamic-type intramembrane protease [Clostridium]EGT3620957.1 CPBP family intramembrane metalloprotease [Clostridium perfringens]PWX32774.1 CPBP family intramembrane metalloprotease [Clostridium perfringens]USQ64503.1 CPBP family intramembrane metalloprotease [Clostridium sp. 16K-1-R1]HAT4310716.1 CPBP family intramembrane metalloprotease [Clostridium perfringens]
MDFLFIIPMVALILLIDVVLGQLIDIYIKLGGKFIGSNLINESVSVRIIFASIVGPIIESFLIIGLINLSKKFIKSKFKYSLLVALIFSLLHYYSLIYIFCVIPSAIIMVFSYTYYKPKKLSPFWILTLIHMINNFIITMS